MMTPAGQVEELVRFVQTGERLRAALGTIGPVVESIQSVKELTDDLDPELDAALTALEVAVSALSSAMKVAEARLDNAIES